MEIHPQTAGEVKITARWGITLIQWDYWHMQGGPVLVFSGVMEPIQVQ